MKCVPAIPTITPSYLYFPFITFSDSKLVLFRLLDDDDDDDDEPSQHCGRELVLCNSIVHHPSRIRHISIPIHLHAVLGSAIALSQRHLSVFCSYLRFSQVALSGLLSSSTHHPKFKDILGLPCGRLFFLSFLEAVTHAWPKRKSDIGFRDTYHYHIVDSTVKRYYSGASYLIPFLVFGHSPFYDLRVCSVPEESWPARY
jgi:hypothetical protein